MANEYMVNASDVLSIANAIREKGGTTEGLVFPDGFVSSIQAIQSGSGLNFTVVGGTTEPNNPVENMLWVNTEVDITSWTISGKEPEDLLNGIVWFKLAINGNTIDAVDSNDFFFAIQFAKQYQDGQWVDLEAKIYRNESWESALSGYAIYDGNWHDSTGFKTNRTASTIIDNTVSPATVQFSGATTHYNSAAYIELQIDGYDALEIEYTFTGYQWAYIGISTDTRWYDAQTTNLITYKYHQQGTSVSEKQTITLPLSGLSGTYYLKIYSWAAGSHTFSLYNMRLI